MKQKHFFLILVALSTCLFAGNKGYSLKDCNGVYLDHKLVKILNKKNGVFIEAGANDGITQSNTKLLEERYGWTGILVEPSPGIFQKLKTNRPSAFCYQCALGSFEENNTFIYGDFDGNLMSSVSGVRRQRTPNQKVIVRSLQSILDELNIKHVDFFSLDTEGYELNILKGVDFSKTTFSYIMIEVYKSEYDEIVSLLDKKGYKIAQCISNYSKKTNPRWDGMCNDYLFIQK